MSDTAKKEYDEAVQRFWDIWVSDEDKKRLPKPKKLSDITMKHFHHTQGCDCSVLHLMQFGMAELQLQTPPC